MPPKGNKKEKESKKEDKDGDKENEGEVQLTMLIASTFANDELESKKQTLSQYYEIAGKQKEENQRLKEEMQERDRDSLQVVEFLRREVEKKQELIESLKTQSDDQREKAADLLRDREEELNTTIAIKDELLEEKEVEIKRLEDELESVAKYKRDKHEMESAIKKLKQDISDTKEKYERELSKLRFQSLEEKVRLKHEEKDLNDRFSHAVNQKAMELLDGQTRSIHSENTELRMNHHKLEKEYMLLSKQSKILEEEKRRKEREIELGKHSIGEYSKQSYRSHKEIRELASRNRQLERNATKLVRQYEEEKQDVAETKDTELSELKHKLHEMEQALKVRSIELHRIRRLARVIIQQRSELEMFFTEALEYVRNQIAEERKSQSSQSLALQSRDAMTKRPRKPGKGYGGLASGNFRTHDEGELPPISAGSSEKDRDVETPKPSDRLDISELSWLDKERILRILFAKISTSQGKKAHPQKAPTPIDVDRPPTVDTEDSPVFDQQLIENKTFVTQQQLLGS